MPASFLWGGNSHSHGCHCRPALRPPLARLREFAALQKANPGLSGTALAERLHAIARAHPLPAGDD